MKDFFGTWLENQKPPQPGRSQSQNLKHGGNGGRKSEGTEEFRGCNDDEPHLIPEDSFGYEIPPYEFLRFLRLSSSVPSVFQGLTLTLLSVLSQFQGRESKQREHQGRDPEPDNDLRFRPADQFKVVVNGRHLEDAFLAQFVRAHLQDHRKRFNHEDSADKRKQQFLLNDDHDGPDGPAQSQRAHVTHEYLGGMRVVPEKPDARTHHGPAEDRELRHLGHFLQLQVFREIGVSADVGQHRQRSGGDDRASDGQSVEPVGEIHGVARSDDHQHHKQDKGGKSQPPERGAAAQRLNDQIGAELLHERNEQV